MQEPATRSPGPQRDPALPHTPTMPPPESLAEGHQPSPSPSPTEPAIEEEFQFLHCQGCQAEAKCPKLLPCLHTLCSRCLEASSVQCPICQAPRPSGTDSGVLDNVFFESLRRRLSVYQQIIGEQALCIRCKELADFWCYECEQLLCTKCTEAHHWFLKHEARPLEEIRSQSAREFLDSTRKTNNIFCYNPNHRTPTLTSIYCRGCSKPLCCSCALLDSSHSDLKCDISQEIQQRKEELDTITQALQEQDAVFGAAQAKMHSAVSQLGRMRKDTEELIRSHVRRVVAHVLAQERELLEAVNERYQHNYEEMAGQLRRLDAVLQRIHTGSALVQKMKSYASDQEVLDMHGFLREALTCLRQEEPQGLQAAVRTDSFDELKVRLQALVSGITQGTDAALPKQTSPQVISIPQNFFDIDMPEEVQGVQVQSPGLAEAQPVTVVESVPGAHPVLTCAYSIKDPYFEEEVSIPRKRKSCQTECPRKIFKMESEEEKEARLSQSSPEQPRPSTSKAVSPPCLEGPPRPKSPIIRNEGLLPNSSHETMEPRETEERVVVISSSEDSDAENSHVEPMETAELCSSPAQPLLRAPGAFHPCWSPQQPQETCSPQTEPPHHSAKQAAIPEAEYSNQRAILRGISFQSSGILRALHQHPKVRFTPRCTSSAVEAATRITTGPPNQPDNSWECPVLQRTPGQPRRSRGPGRSRGYRCLRGSSHLTQWLNRFFSFPLPSVTTQLNNASISRGVRGVTASQTRGAGLSPGDSNRAATENPQVQAPLEAPSNAFLSPHLRKAAPSNPDLSQTNL